MCGLTGFLSLSDAGQSPDQSREDARAALSRMTATLHHRGPDDGDVWIDERAQAGLGHRRLAILDLSPQGRQPMVSACGRYVLAYNGEIYNHLSLRAELESLGTVFRGRSDTETLLAGIAAWGIRDTIRRCIGMFAFAVWDTRDRLLTLVRDRLGIKPLYYGVARRNGRHTLLFGSELKALREHPDFDPGIDRTAVQLLLQHSCIPAPRTIYEQVFKLSPGSMLTVGADAESAVLPRPVRWWDIRQIAERQRALPCEMSSDEAIDQLEHLLSDAVQARMLADVPLGAFLSGGIDSSLVVALMQQQSSRPVQTFSIGFEETDYDEATYARSVAGHLGTQHTELYVTPRQARDVIPQLPELYDEPFADSSQIPMFLVSRLARQHVTVALSGDGGDELFGGYGRYFHLYERWRSLERIPSRALLAAACARIGAVVPDGRWKQRFLYRAHLFGTGNAAELYQHANLHWPATEPVVADAEPSDTLYWRPADWAKSDHPIEQWMWLDAATYLPDDILTKVDRASMAVSLEARVPLLDHRVAEFAWSLPPDWKVAGGQGKRPLRQLLKRHVPEHLFERPKMGFGVPIDEWLRGPLRDWAEALLDESRLRQEGFIDPDPVRRKWTEHLARRADWHYHLWDVLMFQSWLETQV